MQAATDKKAYCCKKCGCQISKDEAAVTKKLINRGTTRFFCAKCLAAAFGATPEDIWAKVRYYKEIGCTLFIHENEG